MSALFKSLDETVDTIRATHEAEMKACQDRTLAAEIEASLLRDLLAKANEAKSAAERVTAKLIAQFGAVEAVFAEAKALALAAYAEPLAEAIHDSRLPEVTP